MLKLLAIAVALSQTPAGQWQSAWDKAKARADLRERYRHGLIDRDALMREQLKLLTPQEEAEVLKALDADFRKMVADRKRTAARRKEIEAEAKKRGLVKPQPPADVK